MTFGFSLGGHGGQSTGVVVEAGDVVGSAKVGFMALLLTLDGDVAGEPEDLRQSRPASSCWR